MKIHYLTILFIILSLGSASKSYSQSNYNFKREVSIDATSVIGNLLSLNSERARSPYGFGMRFHFDKWSLRLSGNTFYETEEVLEFVGNELVARNAVNHQHSVRIGYEQGIDVANRFRLLYGLDLLAGYESDNSNLGTTFNRKDQSFIGGIGPALRIEYRISDRFLLTTESTLYVQASYNVDSFKLGFDPRETNTNVSYRAALALPNSLTVSIGF